MTGVASVPTESAPDVVRAGVALAGLIRQIDGERPNVAAGLLANALARAGVLPPDMVAELQAEAGRLAGVILDIQTLADNYDELVPGPSLRALLDDEGRS